MIAASSTTRMIHSAPPYGRIGSPIVRRWWAYSSKAAGPAKTLRLPYMWASRKPIMIRPLTAISALSATVDRAAFCAGVSVDRATGLTLELLSAAFHVRPPCQLVFFATLPAALWETSHVVGGRAYAHSGDHL